MTAYERAVRSVALLEPGRIGLDERPIIPRNVVEHAGGAVENGARRIAIELTGK